MQGNWGWRVSPLISRSYRWPETIWYGYHVSFHIQKLVLRFIWCCGYGERQGLSEGWAHKRESMPSCWEEVSYHKSGWSWGQTSFCDLQFYVYLLTCLSPSAVFWCSWQLLLLWHWASELWPKINLFALHKLPSLKYSSISNRKWTELSTTPSWYTNLYIFHPFSMPKKQTPSNYENLLSFGFLFRRANLIESRKLL